MKKAVFLTTFVVLLLILTLSGCDTVANLFNKPPVWSTIPDQTILKGQTATVDLKQYVSDPDNNLDQIVLKTTGKGSISNGVYTWTPTEVGTYEIEVEAVDKAGAKASKTFKVIVQTSGTLVVNIAQYNSGPVVEGAKVEIKDADGNLRGVGYSDSKGIARVLFRADAEKEFLNVFISKEGHARTTILGMKVLKDEEVELTTTLRKATAAQTTTEIPIEVDVKLYTDATKATELDPATDIMLNSIYVSVVATPVEFGGGINIIYAKVGGVPGTSYFTSPRLYVSAWNELEGSLSVLEFEGEVPLIVDVYDHNDNKVEKIIWLNVVRTSASSITPYVVQRNTTYYTTQYDLYAYTRRQAVQYYSGPKVPENVKGVDVSGNTVEPTGAPDDDSNLWIEVRWRRWFSTSGATKPKAYRVYRSFDGENWTPIATLPESYYYYRDSSPLLEVGKKTWYAVSSVYDGAESTLTVIGHITPLPLLNIEVVSPTNGSTNVPRDTVFKWKFTGLESYAPTDEESPTTSLTYTYSIWIYDLIQNDYTYYSLGVISDGSAYYYRFSTPEPEVEIKFSDYAYGKVPDTYWVDFGLADAYAYDKLQANKTFNWTLRHAYAQKIYDGTKLTDPNLKFKTIAYSVHADETNVTGTNPKASVYYTFTTGTN
ncbi:MAG: Ig-like domain-containing protein [Fervidobacterium sp.]|uniref:Ig-like domain-containing protein n=1 Tax=Fervidobacterium sp. TaxID=1871331 RepID=UPI00404A0E28